MTYERRRHHVNRRLQDVFERITAAIESAQDLIFESEGSLTTLTVSIVCPSNGRWLVCSAIVGDSNAYVYSRREKSVLELTQGRRRVRWLLARCSLVVQALVI